MAGPRPFHVLLDDPVKQLEPGRFIVLFLRHGKEPHGSLQRWGDCDYHHHYGAGNARSTRGVFVSFEADPAYFPVLHPELCVRRHLLE